MSEMSTIPFSLMSVFLETRMVSLGLPGLLDVLRGRLRLMEASSGYGPIVTLKESLPVNPPLMRGVSTCFCTVYVVLERIAPGVAFIAVITMVPETVIVLPAVGA